MTQKFKPLSEKRNSFESGCTPWNLINTIEQIPQNYITPEPRCFKLHSHLRWKRRTALLQW